MNLTTEELNLQNHTRLTTKQQVMSNTLHLEWCAVGV